MARAPSRSAAFRKSVLPGLTSSVSHDQKHKVESNPSLLGDLFQNASNRRDVKNCALDTIPGIIHVERKSSSASRAPDMGQTGLTRHSSSTHNRSIRSFVSSSPTGKEKSGYPTQKPLGILRRIVQASSNEGDVVLDFFAGSGTAGVAAHELGRRFILVDKSKKAVKIMRKRLPKTAVNTASFKRKTPVSRKDLSPSSATDMTIARIAANADRVNVIAAGVWQYDNLAPLRGPEKDLQLMRALLTDRSSGCLFKETQLAFLTNPTSATLRNCLRKYATSRSAHGDILIFYFSGHGCRVGENDYGLCCIDAELDAERKSTIPLSVLNFRDIIRTLAIVEVHPIFILDACYSGLSAEPAITPAEGTIQDSLQRHWGGSYGILCSSHEMAASYDSYEGGVFTRALCEVARQGRSDKEGKRWPFITLEDLAGPLRETLTKKGHPLSRCHIGPDLPRVPIVRNSAYRALSIRFSPYMRKTIDLLFKRGKPYEATIADIRDTAGPGPYGNHRKLSLKPWRLVEDGSSIKSRKLTERGIKFAKGKLCIPRQIICDPITKAWQKKNGTHLIYISEA